MLGTRCTMFLFVVWSVDPMDWRVLAHAPNHVYCRDGSAACLFLQMVDRTMDRSRSKRPVVALVRR
jgi:hypothetical protein